MSAKMNVPELRFKEFDEEWETVKLKDLASLITKGTTPKEFILGNVRFIKIESLDGIKINKDKCLFIDKYTHDNELKRSILKENDILFAIAGATIGKVAYVTNEILPANTNQALSIIRLKDISYLNSILQIMQSKVMKKYILESISVGAQPNLNLKQIGNFAFFISEKQEQEKIASFLSSVDTKIEQLTAKGKLLDEYKKGVMQKIFSQEIRFRDDDGSEYPEWVEKKLGDIATFFNSKRVPLTESDRQNGIYPYYGASGIIDYVNDYIFDGQYILLGEDGANILMRNSRLVFLANGKFWVNNHAHVFQAKESNSFLCEALEQINYSKYNTGTAQPKLNSEVVKKIKVNLPSKPEQTKIANFLSSIDSKIEQIQKQLDSTKEFKKALLQQMFV